jgi:spermidine/putrescine transport system permease protein
VGRLKDGTYISQPNRSLRWYAVLFMLFLYVPILLIPLFSFNSALYVKFPLEHFTLDWYVKLMARGPVFEALGNSFRVGVTVSIIATLIGVVAAKAMARRRLPGRGPILGFIMLPLVVPGIIFGVALLVLISKLGVPLSLYTVALGHLVICLPFAVSTLRPRFEGFDQSIEEASADLGENGWFTFWRITFPVVAPGVVASLLMCFTISFDEFIMAFFLSGTDQTLPIFIWGQLRFPQQFPSLLALSSLILLASFAITFLSLWIGSIGLHTSKSEISK